MAARRKSGRPSKGDRRHVSAKIPVALLDALEQDAQARGLDRTAVLVEAIAERYGLPNPFASTQEALPLTNVA